MPTRSAGTTSCDWHSVLILEFAISILIVAAHIGFVVLTMFVIRPKQRLRKRLQRPGLPLDYHRSMDEVSTSFGL